MLREGVPVAGPLATRMGTDVNNALLTRGEHWQKAEHTGSLWIFFLAGTGQQTPQAGRLFCKRDTILEFAKRKCVCKPGVGTGLASTVLKETTRTTEFFASK